MAQEDEELASSPFEDDGARNFYAALPDLHALVPGTLLPASQGPTDPEADAGPKSLEQGAETGTTPSTAKDGPEQAGLKPEGAGEQEITAGEVHHVPTKPGWHALGTVNLAIFTRTLVNKSYAQLPLDRASASHDCRCCAEGVWALHETGNMF